MTQNKLPYVTDNQHEDPTGPPDDQTSALPTSLQLYADRADVQELAGRITRMLPAVKELGEAGALALAQVSIAMGLNPFIGELWAIPKKGGGFSLMTGIKGLRRAARQQSAADDGMYTISLRQVTPDEAEGLRVNPGDILRACDLYHDGRMARRFYEFTGEIPKFTGIGVYRQGEATKMNPIQVARKRAEADALKQAFDLPIGLQPEVEQLANEDAYPLPAEPPTRGRNKLFKHVHPRTAASSTAALPHGLIPTHSIADTHIPDSHMTTEVIRIPRHWITDPDVRRSWWAWARDTHGLAPAEVLEILAVPSMLDYPGSQAKARWELDMALLDQDPGAVEDIATPPADIQEEDQCHQ